MDFVNACGRSLKHFFLKYLAGISILSGFLGIIFVSIFFVQINDFFKSFLPFGMSDPLSKASAAILGAGIFAVIMKSAQFTSVFQKHIYDVFYHPHDCFENSLVIDKWKQLTRVILKSTLTEDCDAASNKIYDSFLNSDIHYQFENLEAKYDVKIDATGVAEITSTTKTRLTVTPKQLNPILKQSLLVGGPCELILLTIDNNPIDYTNLLTQDQSDPHLRHFELKLEDYLGKGTKNKTVNLLRTYRFKQDLNVEPYVAATYERYIKGCLIKIKVPEGYKTYLKPTGQSSKVVMKTFEDAEGFQNWVLAGTNDLLLPGQGYIIILNPIKK